MNTTTNYGLKLYEGTDLFNPLTVENVNAGDIDTAMKAISDHSVGAATELTTGTVHAITRADADRNVFLFVATSNFTAGDTFTLDGNQVSALTPDGQQLATGSYVIGSSVLCALHDTLITVYVNPAKAKDADMLDGHDSSYYATDSDLDTVAGTIQAVSDKVGTAVLTTTAPDCSGAINELNTQLNEVETLTITAHSYITSYLAAHRFGNKIHLTGAFAVNTQLPINTDFLYIQRASGQSGSVVSGEVTQAIVESIGAQPNNAMRMNSNSNHFTNNFGVLAVGTYIVDCWYVCKVN